MKLANASILSNITTQTCTLEQDQIRRNLKFLAYFIITPIHFLIGMAIHLFCLWSVCKRGQKEVAYNYQIFVIAMETCEIICFTLSSFGRHWCSSTVSTESWWCGKNYPIMFFGGRLSIPLVNGLATTRLLLSVSMAIDRFFAMRFPFVYRNISHKLHQFVALIICIFLGLATSVFDCFRNILVPDTKDPGRYKIGTDQFFVDSPIGVGFAALRSSLRIFGLLILVIFNVLIIKMYKRQMKQLDRIASTGSEVKEKLRKFNEKTLTILTIVQSIMTFVEISFYIFVYIIIYGAPTFWLCRGQLFGTCLDIVIQLTIAGNLFVAMSVSPAFRRVILRALRKNATHPTTVMPSTSRPYLATTSQQQSIL